MGHANSIDYEPRMQRRAWIFSGALAAGAAAATLLHGRPSGRIPAPSKRLLSHRSGPFALPEGFECLQLTASGQPQTDGSRTPDLPDGMACFEGPKEGQWTLMRNHELMRDAATGAYPGGQPDEAFRKDVHGGVSRLVLDSETLQVVSSNMVLTGTLRNCAGGPTPWGWISCEETVEQGHGYCFLCPTGAERVQSPRRLPAYGRFRHEAVAVEPDSSRAYLTEDDPHGCLYRFTPEDRRRPFEGKLEALRVVGRPALSTSTGITPRSRVKIDWVPVNEAGASTRPLHAQGAERGAASFARAEGIWLDGDGVVFTATTGGRQGRGQVFRLGLSDDTLQLVAESESADDFSGPDNITVAPWGDFIVAEDGPGPQHVIGVRRDGTAYPILRNERSNSELCGVCFSPDTKVLFCNVQHNGLTVAIRGPWETLRALPGA